MTSDPTVPRKPVVALMGEFSAGKSTLANLLIGSDHLPMQVIATRLPPVWIAHGAGRPYRVALDGSHHPVELSRLAEVPLADTLCIRLFCQQDILLHCDLIDMPGISDPNMAAEIWQRVLPEADAVLWCSHATQAWRQSEAAVWASVPGHLHARSLLLLTRIDKLVSERDRDRVIRRVRRETDGLFVDCLPISLTEATGAGEDYEAWAKSGADAFAKALVDLLASVADEIGAAGEQAMPAPTTGRGFGPRPCARDDMPAPAAADDIADSGTRVVPRRVMAPSGARHAQRPGRSDRPVRLHQLT